MINHIYTVKKGGRFILHVAQDSIDEFHHSMDKSMKATKILSKLKQLEIFGFMADRDRIERSASILLHQIVPTIKYSTLQQIPKNEASRWEIS